MRNRFNPEAFNSCRREFQIAREDENGKLIGRFIMTKSPASRPFILYFLMLFLSVGWSFIGFNFAGVIGGCICIFIALVVNFYALGIQEEE